MAIEYHLRKHEDKGQFIPQGSGERLMFITHGTSKYTEREEVKMVLDGGCSWVQLRMKGNMNIFTAREIGQLINEHTNKCIYCINDNARIALRCGANAVHLGKEDISVSAAWEMAKEQLFPDETFYIGATANTFPFGQTPSIPAPPPIPLKISSVLSDKELPISALDHSVIQKRKRNSVPFSVWKDTEK